ncbi:replication terminator protein [Bacillus infantis]|uniref:replication terminator protein n=1 Tax=Bacillus infantis TaxID=324767 RepID=UPI00344F0F7F
MTKIVDLNTFAGGSVQERVNLELQKVLANIADPNTDPKKVRKVTLTLSLAGDDQRNLAAVKVQAKTTLAPAKEIEAKIIMDLDSKGKVTGAELKSGVKGQTYIDHEGEIADDRGEKIISFKK